MIIMKDAHKEYSGFQFYMSMEVPEGRITGLAGRNGAGKSTAIKLILGLIRPDSGSVKVFGREAEDLTVRDREKIGVSLAESGFSGLLNAADTEHILQKMYPRFDQTYFRQKCQELKIPRDKRIKTFSTGMKARLRVLVAMSHRAELLIMDVK